MPKMQSFRSPITPEIIEIAVDYSQYRKMIDELLALNQTTGSNHAEVMLQHTRMNVQRMNRIDKHVDLLPELTQLILENKRPMIWLVLTEAWCGDAAQNIPLFAKLANIQPNIRVRFILRDENPEIMDQFLTRSTRSIPKVVALDASSYAVLGQWGPRPAELGALVTQLKESGMPHDDYILEAHKWYGSNKTLALQKELVAEIPAWTAN
jgi:hypothetical protein